MAEFRRLPKTRPVTAITLHAGNKGIFYYFVVDDKGKQKLEVTTTKQEVADVEKIRMNDDKLGIRQISIWAKKAGSAVLQAKSDGKLVAELAVTVEDKFVLPGENTVAGMFARLLLAESRTPYDQTYKAADSKLGMEWMHLILHNRLATNPRFFNAPGAKTLFDIVKGKKQYQGFQDYPKVAADRQKLVDDAIRIANDDNEDKNTEYVEFVKNAFAVAASTTPVADPTGKDFIMGYWKTAGSRKPESKAELHRTVVRNDFYKVARKYL